MFIKGERFELNGISFEMTGNYVALFNDSTEYVATTLVETSKDVLSKALYGQTIGGRRVSAVRTHTIIDLSIGTVFGIVLQDIE